MLRRPVELAAMCGRLPLGLGLQTSNFSQKFRESTYARVGQPSLGVPPASNDHPDSIVHRRSHAYGMDLTSASGERQLETKFWRYEISNLGR